MNLNITPHHFEELIKKSYSLDSIYLLKLIEQQYDISSLCEGSMKISAINQTLIRKGLITSEDKLTTIGEDLLAFINNKDTKKLPKKKINSPDFDIWWKEFPSTNKFEYKGKKFKITRSFKVKKDACKLLFDKFINEKKYTAKEIIEATKFDVFLRKENSFKKRENQLTYLQNTHTYLLQSSFQGFVDLVNEGVIIKESVETIKGIDI